MHRSWIIWLLSTFAFGTTVAAILVTVPNQNSTNRNVQAHNESDTDRPDSAAAAQLPQVSADFTLNNRISSASRARRTAQGTIAADGNPTNIAPASSDQVALSTVTPVDKSSAQAQQVQQAQSVVGVSYQPKEVVRLAHPSNYGKRYTHDADGNAVSNEYIVVLHETVGSASSALNTFQNNHPRDEDQVSYHTLIGLDGTIYYVVPPEQRAFGAGNSAFQSFSGEEAVFTNPDFPSSVNNFAYHISLETPLDGQNNGASYHSGYTEAQYQSLAWLLARTDIPDDRITTHRSVDRSGSRIDPRSFEAERMFRLLRQYPSRQQAG